MYVLYVHAAHVNVGFSINHLTLDLVKATTENHLSSDMDLGHKKPYMLTVDVVASRD